MIVYTGLHVKCPLFLSHLMIYEFSQQSIEMHSNIKFHKKNCPMGAELFHADGQTHRYYEANSRFWNFSSAPKTDGMYNTKKKKITTM